MCWNVFRELSWSVGVLEGARMAVHSLGREPFKKETSNVNDPHKLFALPLLLFPQMEDISYVPIFAFIYQ